MRELIFNPESYEDKIDPKTLKKYKQSKDNTIGIFELVYTSVNNVNIGDFTKADFKVIKRLKRALKLVSSYKDEDKDSKISVNGCKLVIEEDEFAMLERLFNQASKGFRPAIAEEVCTIFDMLESSTLYSQPTVLEK